MVREGWNLEVEAGELWARRNSVQVQVTARRRCGTVRYGTVWYGTNAVQCGALRLRLRLRCGEQPEPEKSRSPIFPFFFLFFLFPKRNGAKNGISEKK